MRFLSLSVLVLTLLFAGPVLAVGKNVSKAPACKCCVADHAKNKVSSCKYCGMDRNKLTHSRMLLTYEDGTEVRTCSLHCAALDLMLNIGRAPTKVMVGDFDTKAMIDAEKAFWVVDGGKQGVMSNRAKWAFADRQGAEAYVAANGGTIGTFEQALKAAFEDMYEDTYATRERHRIMEEKKEGVK